MYRKIQSATMAVCGAERLRLWDIQWQALLPVWLAVASAEVGFLVETQVGVPRGESLMWKKDWLVRFFP